MPYRIWGLCLLLGLSACAHTPTPNEVQEAKALYSGAKSLIEEKRYGDALQDLQKAEKLYPKDSKTQYLLGVVYFTGFGRTTEAESHLRLALKYEQKKELVPQIQNLLGVVLIEDGRPQEAVGHLEKARANLLYRTPWFAAQNLGLAYLRLGDAPRSIQFLTSALEQDPNLCGAYSQLADAYEKSDKLEDSISTLERFFNHCQSETLKPYVPKTLFASSLYQLGMYHLKNDDVESAKKTFSMCLEEYPALKIVDDCKKSLKLLQ